MGSSTLKAYYEYDIEKLNELKTSYFSLNENFTQKKKVLMGIVKDKPELLNNLRKVESVVQALESNVNNVFNNRQQTIELKDALTEEIYNIETIADDTATLLLDLSDHKLADTKLASAITIGGDIETALNTIVSSCYEYLNTLDIENANFIASDINNSISQVNSLVGEMKGDLTKYNLTSITEDLTNGTSELTNLKDKIISLKEQEISATLAATEELNTANENIKSANSILAKQVELADFTTQEAVKSVNSAIDSGSTNTWAILILSIVVAAGISYATVRSITRPLGRVNEMLNIVASGDLSKKLDDSGKDEFALLSSNCNKVD